MTTGTHEEIKVGQMAIRFLVEGEKCEDVLSLETVPRWLKGDKPSVVMQRVEIDAAHEDIFLFHGIGTPDACWVKPNAGRRGVRRFHGSRFTPQVEVGGAKFSAGTWSALAGARNWRADPSRTRDT